MISARLAGAIVVQVTTFLGPLAAVPIGLLSGELSGVIAPLAWFFVGLPLSYRVLDSGLWPRRAVSRRRALRPVRP